MSRQSCNFRCILKAICNSFLIYFWFIEIQIFFYTSTILNARRFISNICWVFCLFSNLVYARIRSNNSLECATWFDQSSTLLTIHELKQTSLSKWWFYIYKLSITANEHVFLTLIYTFVPCCCFTSRRKCIYTLQISKISIEFCSMFAT